MSSPWEAAERIGRVALSAILAVTIAGCSTWRLPEGTRSELHALPALTAAQVTRGDLLFYSYPKQPLEPVLDLELRKERGLYRVWDLELPSIGDNGQPGHRVRARYFESRLPGTKRLILVLPIYGKSHYPSRKVARYLTKDRDAETTNVLMLMGGVNLYDWRALASSRSEDEFLAEIERTVQRVKNTVIDVRRLLDWSEGRPEIDPDRIGVVGFSFSSILANLTMALDERIAAGVLFMGGGHIHRIFAHCEGNDLQKVRREMKRRLQWTNLHFEYKLEAPLRPLDPIRLASLVGDRPVLLGESLVDAVIPPSSRRDLRRALGEPDRIRLIIGPPAAVLSLTPLGFNYSTRRIRQFFLDNL